MTTAHTNTDDAVRRTVDVAVPIEVAWRVFTDEMGSWWPLATHSLAAEQGVTPDGMVVEGRVGGTLYETVGDDTRTWGTVVEWVPPTRLSVDWAVSPGVVTRWTATFSASADGTRVDLVHTGFGAHGPAADEMRGAYGDDNGWTLVLGKFAEAAARAG